MYSIYFIIFTSYMMLWQTAYHKLNTFCYTSITHMHRLSHTSNINVIQYHMQRPIQIKTSQL